MSKKTFDGIGGSIAYQEGGQRKTKTGSTWEAPSSLIVDYHGNKSYVSIETMKFLIKMIETEMDLARLLE